MALKYWNIVSIQHLYWITDTLWHLSKVNKTTSSKQTPSFNTRNEMKTIQSSNFPNTILIRVPCLSLLSTHEYSLFIQKKIKWPKQTNTLFPHEKRDKTTQCSNCKNAIFIRFFSRIIMLFSIIQNNLFRILKIYKDVG